MKRLSIPMLALALATTQVWAANPEAVAEAARGTALAREGKYDLAIQHYQAALKLDAHLPGLYLNLGLAYFKSQRLQEAAGAFEEAVRADSGNFQARALLGMSYYGCARYGAAAAQLKLASDAQPANTELRYTLAQSYLWSGQNAEAEAQFRILLLKDPESAPVHILLGEVLDASNRVEAATAEFEAAVKASRVPPDAHFGLGYLYWKQQRFAEASHEFEAELAGDPQHAQALTYLGDAEMHLEKEKSAEAHLRSALKLNVNLRLANLDLGIVLADRSASAEAARCFQAAIRIDPSQSDAHYRLGRLWSSMGREKEAQEEFEKVKQLAAAQPPPPLIKLPGRPAK